MGYSASWAAIIIYYSRSQLFFPLWHNCHVISLTYSSVHPSSQRPFFIPFICIRNYRFWYHYHSLCFNFEIYCSSLSRMTGLVHDSVLLQLRFSKGPPPIKCCSVFIQRNSRSSSLQLMLKGLQQTVLGFFLSWSQRSSEIFTSLSFVSILNVFQTLTVNLKGTNMLFLSFFLLPVSYPNMKMNHSEELDEGGHCQPVHHDPQHRVRAVFNACRTQFIHPSGLKELPNTRDGGGLPAGRWLEIISH